MSYERGAKDAYDWYLALYIDLRTLASVLTR